MTKVSQKTYCLDGNNAVANAAIKFIDYACVFPITPSSPMAENVEKLAACGNKNLFGGKIVVQQAHAELGAVGACHGALVNGALASSFTCSQGLLLMISNLYHISGERLPFVLQIANRSVGMAATTLATDHSDLYSIEGTNMCVIQSSNVQECYDMTVVAHAAAIHNQCAFVHSFEGYRVSHQLESLHFIDDEDLMKFVDMQALMNFRNRTVLSCDRPYAQNVGLGNEVYMQLLEAQKYDYDRVPESVEKYFDLMYEVTGRRYHCYEYTGAADAETVVVILGAAGSTVQLCVEELAKTQKVGVLRIRLFRPFDYKMFCAAMPKTAKVVVCLDRAPELVQCGGTIYRETMVALMKGGMFPQVQKVCGGRYSHNGFELTPKDVMSIYKCFYGRPIANMPCEFVVGIVDDLNKRDLVQFWPSNAELNQFQSKLLSADIMQSLTYGLGSDGSIGATRNAVQICQDLLPGLSTQCQFVFDGKKSGGLTVSHVRLYNQKDNSEESLMWRHRLQLAEFDVTYAQYIACHCESYLMRYKTMFANLAQDGIALLNVACDGEEPLQYAEENIPAQMKRDIAEKHAHLYLVNANKIATAVGIPGRTNNILILFYFKFGLKGLVSFEDAVEAMKVAVKKTYAKRGEAVIASNIKAIEETLKIIDQCEVKYDQAKWASTEIIQTVEKLNPWCPEYDTFAKEIVDPVVRREFSQISTKMMYEYRNGYFPPNYSLYEKQCSAAKVPHWNKDKCIMCSQCAASCPHDTIRPFPIKPETQVPEFIETKEDRDNMRYTIQVSQADCRGCGVCAATCPKGALEMTPLHKELPRQEAFEWARTNLTDTQGQDQIDGMTCNLKQLMERNCKFEFAGSCPGCPETTMIKLLTSVVDNLSVVSAVGCSLVWGHFTLIRPPTSDRFGRGLSSQSSLFEDGHVFNWGGLQGRNNERENILNVLQRCQGKLTPEVNAALDEVVNTWEDTKNSWKAVDKLRIVLGLKNFKPGQFNDNIYIGSLTDKQLEMTKEEQQELFKLERGEVEPTMQSFTNLIKFHNLVLSKQSQWYYAGDGACYDIDSAGLDHVLGKGNPIKVIIFANQVFSNTGGQLSKNSFLGQVTKNCYNGVDVPDKQLGQMIIAAYGKNVYVAQCSFGFNKMQVINSIREAEAFNGPAVVICYCPCINHMIKGGLVNVEKQQKLAVQSGIWPVFRWNGAKPAGQRLTIDGKKSCSVDDFIINENRFMQLKDRLPERFEMLKQKLEENTVEVMNRLEQMKAM